jgi:quercetin dioxygenase-like cupin family protein
MMNIVKILKVAKEPVVGPLITLFNGPVTMQPIIDTRLSKNFLITQVNFERGIRNKFHKHDTEQILIVTEGKGIVATENKEITVGPGDVIYIPAGEKHWHGATKNTTFSHLYVMSPDTKTIQLED